MKITFSGVVTLLLCVVFFCGAVCIGAVRGWSDDREELLLGCMDRHSAPGVNLHDSVAECREMIADFDQRLTQKFTGRIATFFGVEPIGNGVEALHQQLLRDAPPEEPREDFESQIRNLIDTHLDTTLSIGKVILTVIFLTIIFGSRKRRRSFPLGKILAGLFLFRLWKKK